jgi:hypothetical protein
MRSRRPGGLPRVFQDEPQFRESLDGDRVDNVPLAGEVGVEDRLAVFDPIGQSAGGDGVPDVRAANCCGCCIKTTC